MTVCSECGAPLDPTTIHVHHDRGCKDAESYGCDAAVWDGCDCPEVCADCCTDPDCPLREAAT